MPALRGAPRRNTREPTGIRAAREIARVAYLGPFGPAALPAGAAFPAGPVFPAGGAAFAEGPLDCRMRDELSPPAGGPPVLSPQPENAAATRPRPVASRSALAVRFVIAIPFVDAGFSARREVRIGRWCARNALSAPSGPAYSEERFAAHRTLPNFAPAKRFSCARTSGRLAVLPTAVDVS